MKQPNYGKYNYNEKLNCKGMPKGWKPTPAMSSERGKRRATREKKKHVHEFRLVTPGGTSYDAARIENERRYYCLRVKTAKRKGGGPMKGCGCTARSVS